MKKLVKLDQNIKDLINLFNEKEFHKAIKFGKDLLNEHENVHTLYSILGVCYLNINDLDQSLKYLRKASALDENNIDNLKNLSFISMKLKKYEEAVCCINKIMIKNPNDYNSIFNLALSLFHCQKFKEAEKYALKVTKINKNHFLAYDILGIINIQKKENEKAVLYFEKSIFINPKYASSYTHLGDAFNKLGQYDKAIEKHKIAISLDPNLSNAYNNLGLVYKKLNKDAKALSFFKKCIEINPHHFDANLNIGISFADQGKKEKALEFYQRALIINPNSAKALNYIVQVKNITKDDYILSAIENLYNDDKTTNDNKVLLGFSLGNIYEKFKDYESSMKYYLQANNFKNKIQINFDKDKEKSTLVYLKNYFYKNYYAEKGTTDEIKMLFVVGMPRSGTTLVEQILAAHPKVHTFGELPYINEFLKKFNFDKFTNQQTIEEELKQYYLSKLKTKLDKKIFYIDKLPINFKWIGFIKNIFPNSKIIHIYRKEEATCFSIFKNNFSAGGNYFSFDLKNIVEMYNLYLDYMQFWNQNLKDFLFNINYEEITEHPREKIDQILNYLNIEWNDNCLNFYQYNSFVKTASKFQVKEKIYKNSSNHWLNYKHFLNPYFKKLHKNNF